MTNAVRRTAACALTTGLALSLAACGGGRQYTVPKQACGVPISEKALDPFLVDGKKFTVLGKPLATGEGNCAIWVDEWLVVDLRLEKVDKLYDPMDELEAFRFTNREKMKDLPFARLGALGDASSMVSTGCAGPTADYLVVQIDVDGQADGDVAERRKHIQDFTLDFIPKVKKALDCTA
ncbi:hypothetical protein ACFVRD_39090 [Streptomyces sp. NPDC057908]|uniref:hypothetical protein n=1 Tax=Streptomyces sp. NPDC057908 TaxID=3346276 RepID=UPI0036E94849